MDAPHVPLPISRDPHRRLAYFAGLFLQVREEGGANRGPWVEEFQRAVDGKARGEPWCMCAFQFWVRYIARELDLPTKLPRSEHCLTVWNLAPDSMRASTPEIGYGVIWRHGLSSSGHVGVVEAVDFRTRMLTTIEGNTGPGAGVIREGDGVYRRQRKMGGEGQMSVVGYLRPWPVTDV